MNANGYKIAVCGYKGIASKKSKQSKQWEYDKEDVYHFRCQENLDIKEHDLVVVEHHNSSGFALVRVVDILENNYENAEHANLATQWVVDKVDTTDYVARKEAVAKLEWIESQMRERMSQVKSLKVFEEAAKDDVEMQKLLAEFKETQKK